MTTPRMSREGGLLRYGTPVPHVQALPGSERRRTVVSSYVEVEILEGAHADGHVGEAALHPRKVLLGVGRAHEDQFDPYGEQGRMVIGEVLADADNRPVGDAQGRPSFVGKRIVYADKNWSDAHDFSRRLLLNPGMDKAGLIVQLSPEEVYAGLEALPDLDRPGQSLTGDDFTPLPTWFEDGRAALAAAQAELDAPRTTKDRYDLAHEALTAQTELLGSTVSKWNPHNQALWPKVKASADLAQLVRRAVDGGALDLAGGDRDAAAERLERQSVDLEQVLVEMGARRRPFVAQAPSRPVIAEPAAENEAEVESSEPSL